MPKRRAACLLLAPFIWMAAVAAAVPNAEAECGLPDGRQLITRTYELPSEADAPPETEFERDGLLYQCVNIQKTEIPYEESRTVTRDIELETDSAETSKILEKLEPVLEYSEDGYAGTLQYLPSSIRTEAKGYKTNRRAITDTRVYPNLDHNDNSLLPQTVTKNGATLRLAGVTWQEQGGGGGDGSLIPTSYTATAQYSATATSKTATGYVTHVTYSGLVKKSGVRKTVYTLTYLGTPRARPFPWTPVVCLGGGLAACIAAVVWIIVKKHRKKKVCVCS